MLLYLIEQTLQVENRRMIQYLIDDLTYQFQY